MTKLWKMMAFMMMALVSVSLTSCGDDDDEDNGGNGGSGSNITGGSGSNITLTDNMIIGLWETDLAKSSVEVNGIKMNYGDFISADELSKGLLRTEFKADHTYIDSFFDAEENKWIEEKYEGTVWAVSGNKIINKFEKDNKVIQESEVIEIDNNHFVIKHADNFEAQGQRQSMIYNYYYKRLK